MSILKAQTPHVVEGITMCNGKNHKVWCTNFNMPVSCLWSGACTMQHGWVSSYNGIMDFSSRSLGALGLYPGYEVAESIVTYYWCVDNDSLNGTGYLRQCWTRGSNTFVNASSYINVNISAPPGYYTWTFWQMAYMTGIDSDEVCASTTYHADTRVTASSGDDISIPNCRISMDWLGVPSTNRCSSSLRGSIWVEGNNLHFINSNRWEHSMTGDNQGGAGSGKQGHMWIDNSHYLHWVGADCNNYRAKWRVCQFCSTFSNSSGPNPSPGAGYKGAVWADSEFGETHLAYIGCDGHKYIAGAGRDPTE